MTRLARPRRQAGRESRTQMLESMIQSPVADARRGLPTLLPRFYEGAPTPSCCRQSPPPENFRSKRVSTIESHRAKESGRRDPTYRGRAQLRSGPKPEPGPSATPLPTLRGRLPRRWICPRFICWTSFRIDRAAGRAASGPKPPGGSDHAQSRHRGASYPRFWGVHCVGRGRRQGFWTTWSAAPARSRFRDGFARAGQARDHRRRACRSGASPAPPTCCASPLSARTADADM